MSENAKQMPLIKKAGETVAKLPSPEEVQHDPELMQAVAQAQVQAFVGQRDEALARAADLFAQLAVTNKLLERALKENAELRMDIDTLTQKSADAAAS